MLRKQATVGGQGRNDKFELLYTFWNTEERFLIASLVNCKKPKKS